MNPLVPMLLVGAAVFWGWYVLVYLDPPLVRWPRNWLRRVAFFDHLIACPFCCGFWLSLIGVVWFGFANHYSTRDWWTAPVEVLAAAGLVGLVANLIPDDGQTTG